MQPPAVRFDHDQTNQLPGGLVELINANPNQRFEMVTYARFGRELDKNVTTTHRGLLRVHPGNPNARHWSRRRDKVYVPGFGSVDANDILSVTVLEETQMSFWERLDALRGRIATADRLNQERGGPVHPDRDLAEAEVLAALALVADMAERPAG